ncbi:MAG TPA: pyridoxamine 5'-phosphate oxidase family protein, partial [Acidimicrobiales bacterium]|nr:pyridoxamine 5'-phosphate oxidase family protein [Acidimicrobiales bacterium]
MAGKSELRRMPDRAVDDPAERDAVLDEGIIAHVGLVAGEGAEPHPVVIPMLYARLGQQLLLHGSPASRLLRTAKGGVMVCVTVTLVDDLVLARSGLHHSMNYRSVVVFGTATEV